MDNFEKALLEGKNIFLTGPGGSGKTHLIQKYRDIYAMDVTSTTGASAINIGGRTIHAFTGIGISNNVLSAIKACKKNKNAPSSIERCKRLVIDEVSMLGAATFEVLDAVFQHYRKDPRPFGGVQLILTGDFFQLPPVNDAFCFHSESWSKLNIQTITLTKLYRFTDQVYSDILLRVRDGTHTKDDISSLKSRVKAYETLRSGVKGELTVQPTILYGKKMNVDEINTFELGKIKNPLYKFSASDTFEVKGKDIEKYALSLDKMIPKVLEFKVGSQVMITSNIDVDNGVANGTRGCITGINNGMIDVKLVNGQVVSIEPMEFNYEENEKVLATRAQFPLILAFALTIHKCQGSTIDCAIISLGDRDIFEYSQAYVALSRVRCLEGLYLTEFSPQTIRCHPQVVEFYNSLKGLDQPL